MGIGGLDTEFSEIFRRAFASRVFPPGLVEKLGIQHVKGMLDCFAREFLFTTPQVSCFMAPLELARP